MYVGIYVSQDNSLLDLIKLDLGKLGWWLVFSLGVEHPVEVLELVSEVFMVFLVLLENEDQNLVY